MLELCDLAFRAADGPAGVVELHVPALPLTSGTYAISIMMAKEGYYDHEQTVFFSINPDVYCCVSRIIEVDVVDAPYSRAARCSFSRRYPGVSSQPRPTPCGRLVDLPPAGLRERCRMDRWRQLPDGLLASSRDVSAGPRRPDARLDLLCRDHVFSAAHGR